MRLPFVLGCLFSLGCDIITDIDGINDKDQINDIKDITPPTIKAIQSGLVDLCSDAAGANSCATPVLPVNISTTDAFRVRFSESLDPSTIIPDTAFLVEGEVDDGFLSDANSPPLTDSRRELLHPLTLSLEAFLGNDNATIVLAPNLPLKEQTVYTLVLSAAVRDTNGAPLVDALGLENSFAIQFLTGDAAAGSPIASLVFPAPAAGQTEAQNVPTNVPRAVVLFSKPVLGVVDGGVDQGRIQLLGGDKLPVSVDTEDGRVANVPECNGASISQCFAVNINEELLPNASQQIILQSGITDTNGAALVGPQSFRFTTGAGPDNVAPQFLAGPDVVAQDISAVVSFTVDEQGVGAVRFGQGALTSEAVTVVTDLGGGQFRHQATLSPLTADTNFLFEARVTDFAGNTSLQSGNFTTAPPLPKLVISEVLANPQASSESTEEFIEIFNADAAPIDLGQMAFRRLPGGTPTNILPRGGGGTVLQPGQFAVLVGSGFAPTNFTVDVGALVVQSSANLSLSNSTDSGYVIEFNGFILATFTNFLPVDQINGRSVERVNLNVGEVATNFAYSDDALCLTPGRTNSGSTNQQESECP